MKQRTARKGFRVALAIVVAILFSGLAGCMTNPTTGERRFNLMSMNQEIQMGQEADGQISETMGLYPDEALQSYVSDIGVAMGSGSEWPDLPWTFRVIDDETVNAFALPGGYIYVTRGILAHFNSEAQLAGVLGHEIGHVTARHASTRISKMQMTQLGVGLAMVLEPELQKVAPLAGAGMQLLFLSFSRADENESDELGVRYMADMGYNPEALIDVMETLLRVSKAGGGGRLPEWQATHPHPENRQENIRGHIRDLGPRQYKPDGRDDYLRRIDGMVYGADPRQGYSRDGVFYHPVLRFSLHFPTDWTVINQKQAVIAVSGKRDASVQLSISSESSIDAAAGNLYSMQQVSGAGVTRTRINGLPAGIGSFSAQTQQGQIDGSVAFIEYDKRIYQLIGYSGANNWAGHRETVNASLRSFAALTDRRAIDVVPMRLDVIRVERSASLRQIYQTYYRGSTAPVAVEQIALINQLEPESRVSAGTRVKMVR
ncbi:MAG: peptidase M48 [Spirochaetaceae bacterium]|nr:MAG: peptidase M48 [Spirochaetaceae bacterium]